MADRRFAAVVSIDTVGFSRLMEQDGRRLIRALNLIVRRLAVPMIEENDGRLVKLIGDAALAEFPSAGGAVAFSAALQRALAGPSLPYDFPERIQVRIGIHAGDITTADGDILGEAVNIASRLQAEAQPDGILLSRLVADLAGQDPSVVLRPEGVRRLKNIARPVEALSVDLGGTDIADQRQRMTDSQEIRFCRAADGVMLAWTETGAGPPVVKAPNWIGHLEHDLKVANLAPILGAVSTQHRVVRFDARGNGMSDWDVDEITFERFVDDLETVFDEAGIERAPVLAISQGAAVAVAFAARRPERVSAIVMVGSFALGRALRTGAGDKERAAALRAMMQAGWDDEYPSLRDLMAETIIPDASLEDRRLFADLMKIMISPDNMARYRDIVDHLDVRAILSKVEAPCLVLHGRNEKMQPVEQGRKMAAGLPDARFIAYDTRSHVFIDRDACWPQARQDILEFLARHSEPA
ncbi:MAG: alpha/beta fold hydrolase [Pseudomonadota bacterium]